MKSLLMIALLLVFGLALAGCDASTEGAERDRGPVFDDGGVADAATPPGDLDGLDSTVESGQPGGDGGEPDVQPQPPDAGVPARGCSHIDVSGEWVVRSPDARFAFLLRLVQQSDTHAEGAVVPAPQVRCDCGATQMRLVADGDACRLSGRAFEFAGFQEYPGTPDPPTCQDAGFSPSDLAVSLDLLQGAGTACRSSFEIGVPGCDAWPRVPRCTGEGEFEYVDPVVAHRLGDSLDGCTPVGTWYVQRSGGAANGPPTFIVIEHRGRASFTARRWPDQAEGCACGDIEWDAEACELSIPLPAFGIDPRDHGACIPEVGGVLIATLTGDTASGSYRHAVAPCGDEPMLREDPVVFPDVELRLFRLVAPEAP